MYSKNILADLIPCRCMHSALDFSALYLSRQGREMLFFLIIIRRFIRSLSNEYSTDNELVRNNLLLSSFPFPSTQKERKERVYIPFLLFSFSFYFILLCIRWSYKKRKNYPKV